MKCVSPPRARCFIEAFAWAVLAIPWMSCLQAETVFCPSGMLCPEGQSCAANQNICIKTPCGNGIVDGDEVCDDGNIEDGDGCSWDCSSDESCGNKIVDLRVGEVCDEGNTADMDGCSANCRSTELCGNGVTDVSVGEVCDDKNVRGGDGCSANCRSDETCGNGTVDDAKHEACDDGNTVGGDGCSGDCLSAEGCGNRVLDPGEECDDGNKSNDDNCVEIAGTCFIAQCGDGLTDKQGPIVEQCDAGGESKDCNANCTLSVCGDGIVNVSAGEQCDMRGNSKECDDDCTVARCGDGHFNAISGEECDSGGNSETCDADCTLRLCGDGFVNGRAGEQCDTGGDSATCDRDCTQPLCGDGHPNHGAGEECDDGNTNENDDCLTSCRFNSCGDGIIDRQGPHTETCDDGNTADDTSCDYDERECTRCNRTCTAEIPGLRGPYCGDGDRNGPERCDDGNTTSELGCAYGEASCTACNAACDSVLSLTGPFCGDGILNGAERCDDGNADSCGTCDRTCMGSQREHATGSITVNEYVSIHDKEQLILRDGSDRNPVIFEFDMDNDTPGSTVPINMVGVGTNTAAASRIAEAINAVGEALWIGATVSGATVALVHEEVGAFGNQRITLRIQGSHLSAAGMQGGAGANCDRGIGCRSDEDCKPPLICKEDLQRCEPP